MMTYAHALHALRQYRLWRDNIYVGKELGAARPAYVQMLRQRAREAIELHKAARAGRGLHQNRAA